MTERHARTVQRYSTIEEDDVRHVLEIIALDIGRDDSPAHTSLRKIAARARRSVNKVRELVDLAVESGELIRQKEGKYTLYSLNPALLPYGRTPKRERKRENSGKFGPEMKPATLADLQAMEERLRNEQQQLYQRLYHDIVFIVSRFQSNGDTEDIEKGNSKADDIKALVRQFEQETGIAADEDSFMTDWLPVLETWYERHGVEGGKQVISRAVAFARGKNDRGKRFVITSPRSLEKIAANLPENGSDDDKVKVGFR